MALLDSFTAYLQNLHNFKWDSSSRLSWGVMIIVSLVFLGLVKNIGNFVTSILMKRKLARWSNTPKDVVILHGMYGGKYVPSASPFVLKLETFLRMSNIPYQIDKGDPFGPKGKSPWITLNGRHFSDSHFIIEHLSKKFSIDLKKGYSDEKLAHATFVRVGLEEHLYWAGVMWRFAFGGRENAQSLRSGETPFMQWLIFFCIAPTMKKMAYSQGMGRHSEQKVLELMSDDIRALSNILGTNVFLLGNESVEVDAAMFGMLAGPCFSPNSPLKTLLEGECNNVKRHCENMRQLFWPDWQSQLSG